MNRYEFFEVFHKNENGTLTPNRVININGVFIGPGVAFSRGTLFGGVDLFNFLGSPIAGIEENGVLNIRGFYQQ